MSRSLAEGVCGMEYTEAAAALRRERSSGEDCSMESEAVSDNSAYDTAGASIDEMTDESQSHLCRAAHTFLRGVKPR